MLKVVENVVLQSKTKEEKKSNNGKRVELTEIKNVNFLIEILLKIIIII
jgi:hypothetical protein